ncbi:Molecular chaperone IbpA, HSP20 family [Desulfuromusa kysingii]|uniref:Molecular chaperone IbpA, HSP20 family n=1 Tax=Desulfuromusa kysingii TaxID=37625 RepID=A0A1H4DYQ7_9BACT|nr:Hsp20/alpha crystallin family protein [Desulfuromusa kysingii]SEA77913.1 Molecular chaperone IbpA, HSP20 family [Desulfuromusa kysingii]
MTEKQMVNQENVAQQNVQQARPIVRMTPAVDIYETADELVLMADLPGVATQGLQLEVSRGVLTLEGEIQAADDDKQRSYYRQFTLSERIDADAGDAALKDGVLTLRLPKSEAAKPRKINVKTLH